MIHSPYGRQSGYRLVDNKMRLEHNAAVSAPLKTSTVDPEPLEPQTLHFPIPTNIGSGVPEGYLPYNVFTVCTSITVYTVDRGEPRLNGVLVPIRSAVILAARLMQNANCCILVDEDTLKVYPRN